MVGNFGLYYKGTMGARALPMAQELAAKGHDVTLVVPPRFETGRSGVEEVIDRVRVVNVVLPPRVPLFGHAWLAGHLLWCALRERPEVLHLFKPKAYAGLVQVAAVLLRRLRLLDARIVLDTDDWEGKGGWIEIEPFPRPVKWLIAWHEKWCLTHADAVTVASRALEAMMLSLGVPRSRVFYVPNGVQHPDSLRPSEHAATVQNTVVSHPTVLLYTRFFEFGVERLVRVFSAVRDRVPEARLLVVGEGLHGEEGDLDRVLEDAGLDQSVLNAGWVRSADLPKWFGLADVAIYPMDDTLLNRTKCPVKLVDLLSFGVPVVGDRVGQVSEYIEDGESGILVPSGDDAAFAEAVASLLLDADRRAAMGLRARQRTALLFGWDRLISGVEEAYGTSPRGQQADSSTETQRRGA